MTPIRPTQLPPTAQPAPQAGGDAGKLAAQKAFFAMVSGQAQPAAAPVAPLAAAPAPAPVTRVAAAAPADGAQKILRPGSLLDIRV